MQARDAVFLEDLCPKLRARRWRQSLHQLTGQALVAAPETIETFRDQLRDSAETRVRTSLVLEAIAAKEDIQASDEEIDEEIGRMAQLYGMTKEDLKSRIAPGENSFVAESVVRNKTIALLTEKAVQVAPPPETEETQEAAE